MGNIVNKDSWLGQQQLRYVEELIWWNGVMSRKEIIDRFGCSPQQATAVIQSYLELNPKAMEYSLKVRRYLANPKMKCVFGTPSLPEELQKNENTVGQLTLPVKALNDKVTRNLMVAIRQERTVTIHYQPGRDAEVEKHRIIPHAFGFVGSRYHVRAWSEERESYRDFSLSRIQATSWPKTKISHELPVDENWETWEEVHIKINSEASDGVKHALMEDYDLESVTSPIVINCRKAMKPYVLYHMGLDIYSTLPNTSFFEMASM